MIIDANRHRRSAITQLLRLLGHDAVEAAGLDEARAKIAESGAASVDLLLCDGVLADADDGAPGQRLLEDPALATIPALRLSPRSDTCDADALARGPFISRIPQPVRLAEFARQLAAGFRYRRAGVAPEGWEDAAEAARYDDRSVLIAEDDLITRKILTRFLEKRGFTVRVVSDGQAAVEAVLREAFSVVLMDLQMPGLNGIKATKKIRRKEKRRHRRTPIIALTAGSREFLHAHSMEAGMDAYVSKPIQPDKLLEVIDPFVTLVTEAV